MASKTKQYYNIKYPFTINNEDGLFMDLNESVRDMVASELLHIILTRKGDRLRMPNFGTNLIDFIFNPSDSITWSGVMAEIRDAVSTYLPNAHIDDVTVVRDEQNDNGIYVDVKYSVAQGNISTNNRVVVKL